MPDWPTLLGGGGHHTQEWGIRYIYIYICGIHYKYFPGKFEDSEIRNECSCPTLAGTGGQYTVKAPRIELGWMNKFVAR